MSEPSSHPKGTRSARDRAISWGVVLALIAFILVFGAAVFVSVGDRWPPSWDFGTLPDVPGQSPFSTERRP
jgi:hypothetical protein